MKYTFFIIPFFSLAISYNSFAMNPRKSILDFDKENNIPLEAIYHHKKIFKK